MYVCTHPCVILLVWVLVLMVTSLISDVQCALHTLYIWCMHSCRHHLAGSEVWHLSCERYLAQMKSGGPPPRDQSSSSPSRDYTSQRSSDRSSSVPASSSKVAVNGSEAKKEQQSKVSSASPKSDKPKPSDSPLGKFARSDTCT